MKIIDGKKVSIEVLDEIKASVENRVKNNLKIPHLAAILVGDDGPSKTYVNSKIKACERVGFKSSLFKYSDSISENDLIDEIQKINNNDDIVNGINAIAIHCPKTSSITTSFGSLFFDDFRYSSVANIPIKVSIKKQARNILWLKE